MKTPVLFVSHGAPSLLLEPGKTGAAWKNIAETLPPVKAILVISAHWETSLPTLSQALHPETIHDFSGFPAELDTWHYAAPGAPEVANNAALALQQAGIAVQLDAVRGLDHGAWVPLSLMYPQADVPVTQLSIQPAQSPAWHLALGRALQPLREQDVLVMASGSITHNLPATFKHPPEEPAPLWVTEFCDWIATRINAGDMDALSAYRSRAPHAVLNHPSDEHLLPLFVALGAAEGWERALRFNQVMTFGMLAMDGWLLSD